MIGMADTTEAGVFTKLAPGSVAEVTRKFTGILTAKNVSIFAEIDQAAAAKEVGLTLRDTVLVIFGNPAAGTPVMDAAPLSALDLPLKVLIWDDGGQTKVSYYDPQLIMERHGVPARLAPNLGAINALTDALIAAGN
jgi:uncharacterized protein (DUF302 family)